MKKIILLLIIAAAALGIYLLYQHPGDENLATPRVVDFINFPTKENPNKFFRTLKAVVVSLPVHPDKKENMDNIESIIEKALEDDIDLKVIVFGETSLGLFNGGDKYERNISETIPGPLTKMIAGYTTRYNIHIAAGLVESREGKLYNSLAVVDPDGKITVHRKTLLHSIDESNGISKAEPNSQVVTIDGFKFGLSVGTDINDKWLIEQYKKENIDALIYSAAQQVPWFSKWLSYWPYNKLYNAWILAANRAGREGEQDYDGTVFISSPGGYMDYKDNPSNFKHVALIGK